MRRDICLAPPDDGDRLGACARTIIDRIIPIAFARWCAYIVLLEPWHGGTWRPTPTNRRIAPRRDCAFEAHTDPVDKTLGEIRMNIVPTLYLAAVLAGPLHAQVCSGGAGGGIDATGNQCGDAATIGLYANGSEMALNRPGFSGGSGV
jgi:hypothetical protein